MRFEELSVGDRFRLYENGPRMMKTEPVFVQKTASFANAVYLDGCSRVGTMDRVRDDFEVVLGSRSSTAQADMEDRFRGVDRFGG